MQQLPQSAAESIRMQGARSGQLGGWFENAGHDQGHDQIEFAAGLGVDEPVEMQAAQGAEDRGHVAMRAGADDIEGLRGVLQLSLFDSRDLAEITHPDFPGERLIRSEEHTSELQSLRHLVCRLLLEKKKNTR